MLSPGVSPALAGPVYAEARPGMYLHDGATSVTYWVHEWPRGHAFCIMLASLLAEGSHHRRSFAMIFEHLGPRQAAAVKARAQDAGFAMAALRWGWACPGGGGDDDAPRPGAAARFRPVGLAAPAQSRSRPLRRTYGGSTSAHDHPVPPGRLNPVMRLGRALAPTEAEQPCRGQQRRGQQRCGHRAQGSARTRGQPLAGRAGEVAISDESHAPAAAEDTELAQAIAVLARAQQDAVWDRTTAGGRREPLGAAPGIWNPHQSA